MMREHDERHETGTATLPERASHDKHRSPAGPAFPALPKWVRSLGLNVLLVFIPFALALWWINANPIVIFVAAALAIVPLAGLMGTATESLATYLGSTLGGLLNATLGNAPEIIIGLFALHKGLHAVVKASITGSILTNLLFALGLSMVAGGLKYDQQRFNRTSAGMSAGMMLLAAIALIVPSLFSFTSIRQERELSLEISVVLFIVYLLSQVFTLVTHRQLFEEPMGESEEEEARLTKKQALGLLAAVTVALAVMSEILTGAIEPAAESLGLTPIFAGVIVLSMVGNAAELMNAARFARKDKMDLSFGITVGASTQMALLVAPVLMFASYAMGQPLDLLFTPFEVAAVGITVAVIGQLTTDGQSNWIQGVMLLAVYVVLAIGFFFLPV